VVSVDVDSVRELLAAVKSGVLAAFGGLVGYLVDVSHDPDKTFSWIAYGIFVLCAFFVGQVLADWLPSDLPGRGGVIMVAGTSAYPVLQALRSQAITITQKFGK
jgi:hypothetical protein